MSKKLKRSTSKKSKKSSSGKLYTKINYKLSQKEIDSLLEIKGSLNPFSNSKQTEVQKEIINKILNHIPEYKKKESNHTKIVKWTNKIKKNQYSEKKYISKTDKKFYPSIMIFLDIDKNLKNKGLVYFFKEINRKRTKNKINVFKWYDVTYSEDTFTPKTGDIIYFDSDIHYKYNPIQEKDPSIKKKNRFYLHIALEKKKKSKEKNKKK